MNEPANDASARRDAVTLRMLGWFFLVLGSLVLIATLWTIDNHRAMVVNLVSGLALVGVGVGMVLVSRRLSHKFDAKDSV